MKWSRYIRFRSEPYSYTCPKCGRRMSWNVRQGPMGGWECSCGLKIDYKG